MKVVGGNFMTSFEDLSPREKRILNAVLEELKCEVSAPDIRLLLEAKSNYNLRLANPDLQPIAFAVRHASWKTYVYGVIGELAAWTFLVFFYPFFLFAAVIFSALTLFGVIGGQVRGLELLAETLPRFHDKLKQTLHRFQRRRWSAQRRRYNAYKKLCADSRAPILYLRSFSFDFVDELPLEVTRKVDEKLAEHYEQYGPVVAVGGPDDKGPMPGPVRLYFADDMWRSGVIYLMSISQLVIVQAGISQGTLWELGIARQLLAPEQLIISVADPANPDVADGYYYDFKKYAEILLGCELPMSLGTRVHIRFGKAWGSFPHDPRVLMDPNDELLLVESTEKVRKRYPYQGTSKTEAATNRLCQHNNKKFFDWGQGWDETATCERCGRILRIL